MSSDFVASPTPWWRALARADRRSLYWLIGVPALLFIVPALFGHPAIDADNLIQNYPLRVLAGRQIASGHLPLLNPLANSGTPLLGGMNAGALYPLTLLFVFLPPLVAWTINMIAIYVTAGVGMYALLRWHGSRPLASVVAAFSYAWGGAMVGQMVHLGVVQGYSFVPWGMLVLLALSRRMREVPPGTSVARLARIALPWALGEAAVWALTFLSGEPRAIATMELLTIVVVPCVLILRSSYWLHTWRGRVAYLATLLVGFAWGLGIGLVQMLPGWSFINYSERSQVNYQFFGAGSLALRWTALIFNPTLLGGNGAFGQPSYFANYNLAEVTGYAGLLALVASAAFLTRLTWRGWRGDERDYAIYVVIGVVGLFATWGSFTPLGHLFHAIPLYGSTRLPSRNVILVDFPAVVFLGWWLEHLCARRTRDAGLGRYARWLTIAPALLIVALCAALVGWGPSVINWIGIGNGNPRVETGLRESNLIHLVLALAVVLALLVLVRHGRQLMGVLMAVLAVDLAVFLLFASTGLIGGPGPREASRSYAQSVIGSPGRFAMVDKAGVHTGVFRTLGQPNMNVFTHLASVQGYGSLISELYDSATGTHPQAWLNACHLGEGDFAPLRLAVVAITSQELMTPVSQQTSVPTRCTPLTSQTTVRRYFGQVLDPTTITLSGLNGAAISSGAMTLHLLSATGADIPGAAYVVAHASSSVRVHLRGDVPAAGFAVDAAAGARVADVQVSFADSSLTYRLDSHFQVALATSSWRLRSTDGTFAVLVATHLDRRAWLLTRAAGRVTSIRTSAWGDEWVSVNLTATSALDRSEAYLPGWQATAVNARTGRTLNLVVHRSDLIQRVEVPKGSWVVHFHYRAPYIEVGLVASVAALALWLAALGGLALSARRKRASRVLT